MFRRHHANNACANTSRLFLSLSSKRPPHSAKKVDDALSLSLVVLVVVFFSSKARYRRRERSNGDTGRQKEEEKEREDP